MFSVSGVAEVPHRTREKNPAEPFGDQQGISIGTTSSTWPRHAVPRKFRREERVEQTGVDIHFPEALAVAATMIHSRLHART